MKPDRQIIRTARKFGRNLERAGIPVDRLVIFGSHAKGNARADSDIDICVVSPSFGIDAIEEMQRLFKLRREVDNRIEPYPISTREFADGYSPILYEIRENGMAV